MNFLRLAAVFGVLCFPSHADAAIQTWNVAGPGNVWNTTDANWLVSVPWTNGNAAVFTGAGETVEVDGTVLVAGVGGSSAVWAITLGGGFTIEDSNANGLIDISSSGGGMNSSKPIISHAGTNTISANIRLSGASNNNTRELFGTAGAGSNLILSGVISESDGTKGLGISGASSTVTLSGMNSFTGGITFSNNSVRLNLGSSNAAGTGALNLLSNSANLGNSSGGNLTLATNNAINFTSGQAGTTSTHNLTYHGDNNLNMGNGAVFFGGAVLARSINVTSTGTLTLNGAFTQNNAGTAFFKNGTGTLQLGGNLAYTGNTTVSAGTLLLSASSESRFLIQDDDVSNRFLGTGIVNFDGIFRLDITGLTDISGTWNLVNVATLTESFGANFGLAFVGGPSFSNLGEGIYASGGWTFDTSTGDLSLVPEPAVSVLTLFGLGSILMSRRRARCA